MDTNQTPEECESKRRRTIKEETIDAQEAKPKQKKARHSWAPPPKGTYYRSKNNRRNQSNPQFSKVDFEMICEYLENESNFSNLFGDSKETKDGTGALSTKAAFDLFAIHVNLELGFYLNGRQLEQRFADYKVKYEAAKNWLDKNRDGLLKQQGELDLKEALDLMCPCFEKMNALFGKKNNTISVDQVQTSEFIQVDTSDDGSHSINKTQKSIYTIKSQNEPENLPQQITINRKTQVEEDHYEISNSHESQKSHNELPENEPNPNGQNLSIAQPIQNDNNERLDVSNFEIVTRNGIQVKREEIRIRRESQNEPENLAQQITINRNTQVEEVDHYEISNSNESQNSHNEVAANEPNPNEQDFSIAQPIQNDNNERLDGSNVEIENTRNEIEIKREEIKIRREELEYKIKIQNQEFEYNMKVRQEEFEYNKQEKNRRWEATERWLKEGKTMGEIERLLRVLK